MIKPDIVERADRLSRKRAVLLAVSALLFGGLSVVLWPRYATPDGAALLWLWALYAAVAFLLVVSGGALLVDRRVRRLMNDELTIAHRQSAVFAGFCAAMIAAAAVFALPQGSCSGQAAAYTVISSGLFASLLVWALLEVRSSRQG